MIRKLKSIEESGKVRETFPLIADETGIVTKRKVSVGDYVKQGVPIFEMMNLQNVWVLFDAYEEDLASIKVGNKIEFTTPSMGEKTFHAGLHLLIRSSIHTRAASIRTEVSKILEELKPEMLVYGTLTENIFQKYN